MKSFNVINYDCNANKFIEYNIMTYLINAYNERIEKHKEHPDSDYFNVPETFDEFKKFIKDESLYQFWSRCEYEIILVDWPCKKHEEKWDVYQQIMMNLDIITNILMENIKE